MDSTVLVALLGLVGTLVSTLFLTVVKRTWDLSDRRGQDEREMRQRLFRCEGAYDRLYDAYRRIRQSLRVIHRTREQVHAQHTEEFRAREILLSQLDEALAEMAREGVNVAVAAAKVRELRIRMQNDNDPAPFDFMLAHLESEPEMTHEVNTQRDDDRRQNNANREA